MREASAGIGLRVRVPLALLVLGVALLVSALVMPGTVFDGTSLVAEEPLWQRTLNGLYGDQVVDLVFVGETARATRSMLLLAEARGTGRGAFRLSTEGQWQPVQILPEGQRRRVKSLEAAADDLTNKTVYAGLEGKPLFGKSDDLGLNWSTEDGPAGPRRFDVLASCRSGTIYAAEAGTARFWTSGDKGATWSSHDSPSPTGTIEKIFTAPDAEVVYLLAGQTLYVSADEPDSWTALLGPANQPAAEVQLAAVGRGEWLYAVADTGDEVRVMASDDGGATWPYGGWPAGAPERAQAFGAGDIDMLEPVVFLALADGSVYQSRSAGTAWEELGELPVPVRLAVLDEETNDVWAGSDGLGLFRLRPSLIHTGAVSVEALAVAAPTYGDDGLVLALGGVLPEGRDAFGRWRPEIRGVFESTNGESWQWIAITGGLGSNLLASPAFGIDQRLYSGQQSSDDGGHTWQSLGESDGGVVPHIAAVGPVSGTHPVLYALKEPYVDEMTGGGGLVMSADGGSSWIETEAPGQGLVAVAVSPGFVEDSTAFAANYKGLMYRTEDGVTFEQVSRIATLDPTRNLYDLALSPDYANDETVLVVLEDASDPQRAHVYISTSAGEGTWQDRSSGLDQRSRPRRLEVSPSFASDGVAFLGTMVRRTDPALPSLYASQGDNWFGEVSIAPSDSEDVTVRDLELGGSIDDGRLFAAVGDEGFWLRDLDGIPVPQATSTSPPSATPTSSPTTAATVTPTSSRTLSATATASVTLTPERDTATPSPTTAASLTPSPPFESPTATATPSSAPPSPTPTPTPTIGPIYLPYALVERW